MVIASMRNDNASGSQTIKLTAVAICYCQAASYKHLVQESVRTALLLPLAGM